MTGLVTCDPATMLPHNLLKRIVSALVVPKTGVRGSACPSQSGYDGVLSGLAVCSKAWSDVVGIVLNTVDPVIPADTLRSMKRCCRTLDLSFLFDSFEATAQKELGLYDYYSDVDSDDEEAGFEGKVGYLLRGIVLAYMRSFSASECSYPEALKAVFAAATGAYKKVRQSALYRLAALLHAACCMVLQFLAVKAVEALVLKASPSADANRWTEKSMPSNLIDLVWHMHLMYPKHYLTTCSALLGTTDVIDHTPGYVSKKAVEGSALASKMRTLFRKNLSQRFGNADAFENEVITNDKVLWIAVALEILCDAGEESCG
jgi:hypothetical protein